MPTANVVGFMALIGRVVDGFLTIASDWCVDLQPTERGTSRDNRGLNHPSRWIFRLMLIKSSRALILCRYTYLYTYTSVSPPMRVQLLATRKPQVR